MIHSIPPLHSFSLRRTCLCSPPKDRLDESSSGSLDSSDVNSLPTATSPHPTDDAEVASQQVPSQEEVVLEAPQGDLPDSRRKGDRTPKGSKSGLEPDTAPEPSTVPDSGRQPPSKRSKPTEPVTSVQPEAPDNLLEVLNGASIDEEHRTIMSAVIQKVQSAKSGLTEACASLLTGFEVSKEYVKILPHRQ